MSNVHQLAGKESCIALQYCNVEENLSFFHFFQERGTVWQPRRPRPLLSFPPPSFFCQSSLLYAISTQSLVDLFSMMSAPSKTTKTSDQVLPSPTFSTMTFGDSLCRKSNLTNPIDLLPSFHLGKQKEMCGQSNL